MPAEPKESPSQQQPSPSSNNGNGEPAPCGPCAEEAARQAADKAAETSWMREGMDALDERLVLTEAAVILLGFAGVCFGLALALHLARSR